MPGVLIAVVIATLISAISGYEKKTTVDIAQIADQAVAERLRRLDNAQRLMAEITTQTAEINHLADSLERHGGLAPPRLVR